MNRSDDVSVATYQSATFYCVAVTDASTEVTYSWYFNDNSQPIIIDNYTYQFGDSRLMIDTQFDSEGGMKRAGAYHCTATNGYSSDTVTFHLTVNSQSTLSFYSNLFLFTCHKLLPATRLHMSICSVQSLLITSLTNYCQYRCSICLKNERKILQSLLTVFDPLVVPGSAMSNMGSNACPNSHPPFKHCLNLSLCVKIIPTSH